MNSVTRVMLKPAAQYLRMSTGHQKYSLVNQADAIREYARAKSFEIVSTYQDGGRSGLRLGNRAGLKGLLHDVQTKTAHYRAILIYDISRWGRFQDTDEAAYYEFLCRQSGIQVHYIAEPFKNTGEMADSILKALKRTMAAEYSRELGVKCFAGQKRLALLGFRVGGQAGLGYRRVLIGEDGKRRTLETGQYKALTSDRITLTPGPKAEVEFVREMFDMALTRRFSEVLRFANAPQNLKFHGGKPWSPGRIYKLLGNPKYCGSLAWHRTTQKIGTGRGRRQSNDPIIVANAFPGIVEPKVFDRVQIAHKKRTRNISNQEMLRRLTKLCLQKGKLTARIVDDARGVRSKADCIRRFGSMLKIYELIGYKPSPLSVRVSNHWFWTRRLHAGLIQRLTDFFPKQVEGSRMPKNRWQSVKLDDGTLVRLSFARRHGTSRSGEGWKFLPFRSGREHITLLCLLKDDGETVHTFVVMPEVELTRQYQIQGLNDPWLRKGAVLSSLEEFYERVQAMKARKLKNSGQVECSPTRPALPKH